MQNPLASFGLIFESRPFHTQLTCQKHIKLYSHPQHIHQTLANIENRSMRESELSFLFQATNITSTSAIISWLPSNSNFQHTVSKKFQTHICEYIRFLKIWFVSADSYLEKLRYSFQERDQNKEFTFQDGGFWSV